MAPSGWNNVPFLCYLCGIGHQDGRLRYAGMGIAVAPGPNWGRRERGAATVRIGLKAGPCAEGKAAGRNAKRREQHVKVPGSP